MNGVLLFQSVLIGIVSYFASIFTPWIIGPTGGYYTLGRPLVAGFIIGLIMNDVTTGVLCGVAVQAVFITNISTGGSTNSEIVYAGYGGIGLALASNATPSVAVTLSLLVGSLGLSLFSLTMIENSIWGNKFNAAVKKNSVSGMWMNHVVLSQIAQFVIRVVPIVLIIYFGEAFVSVVLESVPDKVIHMMDVLGGLLPALGVALLMNLLIKEKQHLIFFFTGVVFINFLSNSMIALAVFATLIAYLIYRFDNVKGEE